MDKRQSRLRRAGATRKKIRELSEHRLAVHRSNLHIYANIISPAGARELARAATIGPEVRKEIEKRSTVQAAALIGKRVAETDKPGGVERVTFDRSGFRYHGRVKALAEAAREAGLKF